MGIKLDNKKPRDFGLIFLTEHYHPMTPEMRTRTLSIPGLAGEWDFGSEWGPRPFTLPFGIIEHDNFERQRKLNTFVAFLLDPYGRPRPIKLYFDYEPDKYYEVKLAAKIDPSRLRHSARFDVQFIAHDPYKKFAVPSDNITMDSDIPIMSEILWGTESGTQEVTSPMTIEVGNSGSLTIPLAFRIEGSGTNVSLTANGKTMTLGTFTNKTIDVEGNYTVKVNGVPDLTGTNGVFLDLKPGINQIRIAGSNLNLTISESLVYKFV